MLVMTNVSIGISCTKVMLSKQLRQKPIESLIYFQFLEIQGFISGHWTCLAYVSVVFENKSFAMNCRPSTITGQTVYCN